MIITIKKLSYFILLCGFILPSYLYAASSCKQWVAKVSSVQGKVQIKPYDQEAWQSVLQNAYLCGGDAIKTGKYSRVILEFANQAVATIDQNATLIFPPPQIKADSWLINLIEGRGFFRSRRDQDLEIETPFINCVHKGTEFLINVGQNSTKITVFDGEVAAKNQLGDILIKQGYSGGAQRNQAPKVYALTAKPEDSVQWTLYYPPVADYQNNILSSTEPWLNPAVTAYQQGNLSTAIDLLRDLPKVQRNADAMTLEASLLLTVGRQDEAQSLINQAQKIEPHNSTAMALQSVISVAQNQSLLALQQAQQAIEFDPKSATAQIALSYAYQSQFKVEDALKAAQQATDLAPNNALAWARLSELQLSVGNRNAALASAQKAQVLNPNLARIQTIQGFANLAENNIADGSQNFRQAIDLDSSDPIARLGLGLAKIRQGQLEDGKSDLEIAVNLDPNNAILRSYLGKAFYELKNQEYSEKEFSLAKAMDANDPTPWFYDAILKQTTNRPVEALHDMQKAIALNDNRGVYRSKMLLDKDRAARQASLGRIYNSLGFDDVANRLAMKSLLTDQGNYSAHRLLSDSYTSKPRHEIARSSEHLQAQLLQPLNYNPIQPSLAYSDLNIIKNGGPADTAFNEYNRLFERNGVKLITTGLFGSFNTYGDEAALAGIHNKLSYSLGQLHYETDGFRTNNALKHNLYNAFAQYELSPSLNIQAEYRHRETEHGDLQLKSGVGEQDVRPLFRRELDQDTYRLGLKYAPTVQSDVLFSFIHANREENQYGNAYFNVNSKSYDAETQYLYRDDKLNITAGGGIYHTDATYTYIFAFPTNPTHIFKSISPHTQTQYLAYLYSNYQLFNNLTVTAGLSFDHYRDIDNSSSIINANLNELNPKFGLLWKATDYLSFRLAGFKSVKSAIIANNMLQPTQVAGFNQFFDDINGTATWQYGVGMDTHFFNNLYAGVEAYKRDLRVPDAEAPYQKPREELYRLYLNWLPFDNWAFNSEFRFENYRGDDNEKYTGDFPRYVETAYLPTEIRYFHPIGFFASLKGTYVNQKARLAKQETDFNSSFYLVDAAIGYRLPKQYGLVSLEAKNLFDSDFRYRDRDYQMNEDRAPDFVPKRMVFGRITLNF